MQTCRYAHNTTKPSSCGACKMNGNCWGLACNYMAIHLQDELHDAAVRGQKVGEERRETLVEKAKELGSSVTNTLRNFGKSVAHKAEDGADEEAGQLCLCEQGHSVIHALITLFIFLCAHSGLTPHDKTGAAKAEDR